MLYDWLEAQRALTRSMDAWAGAISRACGMPAMSCATMAAPGCEWVHRVFRAAPEPPGFRIGDVSVGGERFPIEETVVDRTAFCALRRFTRRRQHEAITSASTNASMQARRPLLRASPGKFPYPAPTDGRHDSQQAPVLLCAPLAGHHAVMLRETVETVLEDADVFVTDWADARDISLAEGAFGLDDYVLTVERFLRRLCPHGLHVLAICQGTVPTVAAASLVAARGETPPLSLALMGGPIDTRLNPTAVDRFATAHSIEWFRDTVVDVVPPPYRGAGRRVYPGYVQHAAIVAAHPHRQLGLEWRYWASRMGDDAARMTASLRSLEEYAAVLDMTEDYFVDTLRTVFQEQRLARGIWEVGGRRIDGGALTSTALCTVEGDRDDITGSGQTHAAHAVCGNVPKSQRMRLTVSNCDHYDLFSGPRWRETIHRALADFWRRAAAAPRAWASAGRLA
jgi:polyhydroxyalkanoate depolymerase